MHETFGGHGGEGRLGYVLRANRSRTCGLMPCRDGIVGPHSSKEVVMALSDQLTGLAARAKEAEDRAAAAQGKAKADLQADVESSRASAQAQAQKLRESADATRASSQSGGTTCSGHGTSTSQ